MSAIDINDALPTTDTVAVPVSIVTAYVTQERTGQLKANLVPLLEAEVSSGYDALRIRTLEVGEEKPDPALLDSAEGILAQARPGCRRIAVQALQEASQEAGLRRAALLRSAMRAMRVATSKARKA